MPQESLKRGALSEKIPGERYKEAQSGNSIRAYLSFSSISLKCQLEILEEITQSILDFFVPLVQGYVRNLV